MIFSAFRKRDHTATLEPDGSTLVVKAGQRILNAALDAGLDWPHDCRVGSCGTCRCRLKSGRIKPLTDFVYTLDPEDIRQGAILACQSLLESDAVIEIALGGRDAAVEAVRGTIAELRPLTHDIVELTATLDRPAFGSARAGQYLEVSTTHIDSPRSYSLAHAPARAGSSRCTFFIRHVPGGEFTDWLFAADRRGEALALRGPYGNFHLRPGNGRMICIAGGSGLAPIHALLEDAVQAGETRECTVLFGARTRRDLYYIDELAALGARWRGKFELVPVLSSEPADSPWRGRRGLVTDALADAAGIDLLGTSDHGYLCGPPAMVDAAVAGLNALGMPQNTIFFDKFLDASTQPGGRSAIR